MGWQLYFCIPSYKSNSLEETTAVSSWSQYDSNKEAFLVTSKQEGEGKVKHKDAHNHISRKTEWVCLDLFVQFCAYGFEERCHVYDHGWSWYIYDKFHRTPRIQIFVSLLKDFVFCHIARGCSPVSMSGLRWLETNLPGDLHGSTTGAPQGWWMLPTGASGAIFKERLGRWKWMSRRTVATVGVCYIQSVLNAFNLSSRLDWKQSPSKSYDWSSWHHVIMLTLRIVV